MKKMILIGALACFAMPALAENDLNANTPIDSQEMLAPGGPGRGGPGGPGGGIGRGGPGGGGIGRAPGNPGGGIGRAPRMPGNPGGGIGQPPRRPGNPGGGIGQSPRRPGNPGGGIGQPPRRPGNPGGGIGQPPRRHPGNPPGHVGGDHRFPRHGSWGQGSHWWRDRYGSNWHLRFRWWPGFIYTPGACFAQDGDAYLFAGSTGSRAVANCEENSYAGDCEFVGCD